MKKYRVAQLGCGMRGKTHIGGFVDNPDKFEIVALCDLNKETMKHAAEKYGLDVPFYTDVEKMLEEIKPDIFSFVTHPDIRQNFIEIGIKHNVKGISFEKPMATSLSEAKHIADICKKNNIKAIVCHQQKYLDSMQRLKEIVDSGDIGEIVKIHVGTQAWLSQLGTHFMDYALWINGGETALWTVGHVHGKKSLEDSHPSCDYINGTALLKNKVRLYFECGYLSEQNLSDEDFWFDNRLSVYGTLGYAWAETDGAWAALTRKSCGALIKGQKKTFLESEVSMQKAYFKDYADWLDNDEKVHPCNVEISYHGYEILEAMSISALDNTRVNLPLENCAFADINKRMMDVLPDIDTYK